MEKLNGSLNVLFSVVMTIVIFSALKYSGIDLVWYWCFPIFLISYPWKIKKNVYSLFGGINMSRGGNVYSLIGIFQIAARNAVCLFGLLVFQEGGRLAYCFLGLSLLQKSREVVVSVLSLSLFQRAKRIAICLFGFSLFQKASYKAYCGFGIVFFQSAKYKGYYLSDSMRFVKRQKI